MFGIASRALTAKEKGMIERWVCQMQYGDDVLQLAYETTVNAINKASIPYANTILERWYADGYRTIEDVERALAEYRRKKAEGSGSFDVDDFFEAALQRTYGE
jgi:DnaD/phage-associated family protein